MRKLALVFLLLPTMLSAQALGQVGFRAIAVQPEGVNQPPLYGAAITGGAATYKTVAFTVVGAGVSLPDNFMGFTLALDASYAPARFLTTRITPYIGGELNTNLLPGTAVPGTVAFVGVTLNDLRRGRKGTGVFGQVADVFPGWFVEARYGRIAFNGRYRELDFGYAF